MRPPLERAKEYGKHSIRREMQKLNDKSLNDKLTEQDIRSLKMLIETAIYLEKNIKEKLNSKAMKAEKIPDKELRKIAKHLVEDELNICLPKKMPKGFEMKKGQENVNSASRRLVRGGKTNPKSPKLAQNKPEISQNVDKSSNVSEQVGDNGVNNVMKDVGVTDMNRSTVDEVVIKDVN